MTCSVVPRSTSYAVYIFQLICFARASSHVANFNTRNKLLAQKLLKQGYRYHKLRKTFSKFCRRYYDLISNFQGGLKSLLCQGLSEILRNRFTKVNRLSSESLFTCSISKLSVLYFMYTCCYTK